MRNKLLIIAVMLFIVTLISFVTPASLQSLGNFQQGQTVTVKQTCADSTYITISIFYPNSSVAVSGIAMTDNTNGQFSYDFTDTATLGRYDVTGISDGCDKTFATWFDISKTGEGLNGSSASLYIVMIILSFLLLLLFILFGIMIDGGNYSDEYGIIQVNNKKYLKMGCFFMAYIIGIWFIFNLWTVADNFLLNPLMANMFKAIWYFMFSALLPIFIAFVILNIYWLVADKRFKELIVMGVPTNME